MSGDGADFDDRPLTRGRKFLKRLPTISLISAIAVTLLYFSYRESATDAAYACMKTVDSKGEEYSTADVDFQFFGPGVIGWECYAFDRDHTRRHIVSLGLIPAFVNLPLGVDS